VSFRPFSRRITPARRLAVLAVGGLALLGLTACSGGGDEPGSGSSPTASTTEPAGSAGTTASGGAGSGSDAASVADIENAADLAKVMTTAMREAGTVKMKLVATTGTGEIAGQGSMRVGEDPAMQLTAGTGGQTLKLRMVDGAVYLSPGQKVMGKSWIKIDPKAGDAVSKTFAGLVSALQNTSDVERSVAGFDKASSFESTGTATIDGVKTHGYRVVLKEDALREAVGSQLGQTLGAELDGATATYQIHVDDQGLPKRIATETALKSGTSKQTVDYSDWGAAVTIEAPPASQVIDSGRLG
jgi:hypothetical protein